MRDARQRERPVVYTLEPPSKLVGIARAFDDQAEQRPIDRGLHRLRYGHARVFQRHIETVPDRGPLAGKFSLRWATKAPRAVLSRSEPRYQAPCEMRPVTGREAQPDLRLEVSLALDLKL